MSISKGRRFLSIKMRWLLIGLIILSTVLYTIGITIEHNSEKPASPIVQQQQSGEQGGHSEAGETPSGDIPGSQADAGRTEALFGINLESQGFIVAAILAAVLLIVLLFIFQRLALWLVVVFAISATLLDILEVITQLNRANNGVALFALLVLVTHISLAIAGVVAIYQNRSSKQLSQPMSPSG